MNKGGYEKLRRKVKETFQFRALAGGFNGVPGQSALPEFKCWMENWGRPCQHLETKTAAGDPAAVVDEMETLNQADTLELAETPVSMLTPDPIFGRWPLFSQRTSGQAMKMEE